MKLLLLVLLPAWLMAQQVTGPRVAASGTYANRPTSPATGAVYIVTDDSSVGACAGGGSALSQCRWSGSTWQSLGGSGGGSGITALTGDVTASGTGSVAATLATVNSNTGSCGDATHVGQVTLNGKGLATACTAVAITGAGGLVTNPLQAIANLVARTSSTVLTLLPNAGVSTPYGFTVYGGTSDATYNFTTTPTVSITGGSGSDTAYIYVDIGGTLTVGKNNLTMSCSGACTVVSGITAFPKSSIHIATWTASSATWDTSGGTNFLGVGSSVNTASISGGGSSAFTCDTGSIPYTSLTTAGTSQEITIETAIAAATGYGVAYVTQDTNFSGGSATALTVSMGRTGSNAYEMSGTLLPLMSGGIGTSSAPYSFSPLPPTVAAPYDVVLKFVSTGANVNTFTAGQVTWKLCHYSL